MIVGVFYHISIAILVIHVSRSFGAKNRYDRYGPQAFPAKVKEPSAIKLICRDSGVHKNEDHPNMEYGSMMSHGFPSRCPESYDYQGKLHQREHMCTASNQNQSCLFRLSQVIITKDGALIDTRTQKPYSFAHASMGMLEPIYYPGIHHSWSSYYELPSTTHHNHYSDPNPYKLVVPTRMRWDDCFNHLSFQSIPLIAHVYEFHQHEWENIVWHTSLFTAALLRLLNVPMGHIVMNRQIIANEVFLPWVSGWAPPQQSTIYGIAGRVSDIITRNLLNMYQGSNSAANQTSLRVVDQIAESKQNLILYLHRNFRSTRGVANAAEILSILRKYKHADLEVICVNHTMEYPTIEALHQSWHQHAKLFARARLIIGPHGGAFNNLIWAPKSVDIIEFNEFPDDEIYTMSHGATPVRHVFLTAAWAKGITGKFYIIKPSMKHPSDMYTGKLRIAPYELFEVMTRIPGLLDARYTKNPFQPERHGTWPQPNPDFSYIPPPP
jgi:hypothetical protein